SSSVAICVLLRLAVPSRNWSAVNEARPGISAGSESAPDLIHKLQLMVGSLCCSSTSTVKPLGSWNSAGCGSLTFRISLFTGARFRRVTFEGSCLASPRAGCGAENCAGIRGAGGGVKVFFNMVCSLLHTGGAGGPRAGHSDDHGTVRGHQVLLRSLLYLLGGHGGNLVELTVDQVGIVVKNGQGPDLVRQEESRTPCL